MSGSARGRATHPVYDLMMDVANIIIRAATLADVGSLVGLDQAAQTGDQVRIADIGSWVSNGFSLVAASSLELVGYVTTLPNHLFGRDFIVALMVHPSYRRNGVGCALLNEAVSAPVATECLPLPTRPTQR